MTKTELAMLLKRFDMIGARSAFLEAAWEHRSSIIESLVSPEAGTTAAIAAKLNDLDAQRYRFLKARRGNIVEIAWNSFYSDIYATAKMGNVDAAIDKAMQEQSGPQKG